MSRSRAMRRIRQAIRRQIEETQPDHPMVSRRQVLKVTGLALGGALLAEGYGRPRSSGPRPLASGLSAPESPDWWPH